MAVISAFRTAGRAILRNPIVLVVTALFGAVQLPQLLTHIIDPFLADVFSLVVSFVMIFVSPFFQAGLIGMVNEGIDGRTKLGTFVSEGKDHYVSMLGIYLFVVAMSFVFGILVIFGAFAGVGATFATGGEASLPAIGVLGMIALLVVGAYLLTVFFFQFYAQAIVIDDLGAVAGVKHSFRCVGRIS
ncbi:DUF7847 domain-containing protein [Haladaptatus halobius]|uniref:DUF7847 domain-containing protein n=1 Tax=Haladaptatus halobius TaxID=2884875 RepID=UPI001D0AFFE1|nr:hypothetical protein [Haladaptatus halobius]